jgi:antitoxin component YwqK of YwqJK toxin-antitoxin module
MSEGEKFVEYYPNGQKEYERTSKNGKMEGLWTWWYENGQKEKEGNLIDGKEVDKWTFYNEDGTVKEVKEYDKKTKLQ